MSLEIAYFFLLNPILVFFLDHLASLIWFEILYFKLYYVCMLRRKPDPAENSNGLEIILQNMREYTYICSPALISLNSEALTFMWISHSFIWPKSIKYYQSKSTGGRAQKYY